MEEYFSTRVNTTLVFQDKFLLFIFPDKFLLFIFSLAILSLKFKNTCYNQRTNGPVNAHLRSAEYTNVIENSPSIGADEALGPFFFSE